MTVSEDPRYIVYSAFTKENKVNVYEGNDYESAKRTTNFWDERQETWLFDRKNLSGSQKIDLLSIEMMARVNEAVEDIPVPNGLRAEMAMEHAAWTLRVGV